MLPSDAQNIVYNFKVASESFPKMFSIANFKLKGEL